jgi:hypothetical protein
MDEWKFNSKEALHEASRSLIDVFLPFLHTEEEGTSFEENKKQVNSSSIFCWCIDLQFKLIDHG